MTHSQKEISGIISLNYSLNSTKLYQVLNTQQLLWFLVSFLISLIPFPHCSVTCDPNWSVPCGHCVGVVVMPYSRERFCGRNSSVSFSDWRSTATTASLKNNNDKPVNVYQKTTQRCLIIKLTRLLKTQTYTHTQDFYVTVQFKQQQYCLFYIHSTFPSIHSLLMGWSLQRICFGGGGVGCDAHGNELFWIIRLFRFI